MIKKLMVVVIMLVTTGLMGISNEQFEDLDFVIDSQLETVDEFSTYYKIPNDKKDLIVLPLLNTLEQLGMQLSDLDNYVTFLAYNVIIADNKGYYKEFDLDTIKRLVFGDKIVQSYKLSSNYLISNVIINQDEITVFNRIGKDRFEWLLFKSKDFKTDYKNTFEKTKDNIFQYVKFDPKKFTNYDQLLMFIQNNAISALKHRWEKDITYGDLTQYEDLGIFLGLNLEQIEKTIILDAEMYQNSENNDIVAYNLKALKTFMLPEALLKEMSYRANQMFFTKFRKGDILTLEYNHGDAAFEEFYRGYYNHTTLVIEDATLDLNAQLIDPTEKIFFSSSTDTTLNTDYEQRSKYQYTYINHRTVETRECTKETCSQVGKYYEEPEYWQLVRSEVKHLPSLLVILASFSCEEQNEWLGWIYHQDCPEIPEPWSITPLERDNVVNYARSLKGLEYSMIGTRTMYCSKVAWESYKEKTGIDLDNDFTYTSFVSPNDIIDSPNTFETDIWDYRYEKDLLAEQNCPNFPYRIRFSSNNDSPIIVIDSPDEIKAKFIAERDDERSYYQCPDLRDQVNYYADESEELDKVEICSASGQEDLVFLDKLIREYKGCKDIYEHEEDDTADNPESLENNENGINEETTAYCLGISTALILYQTDCPWLVQNSLSCYKTREKTLSDNNYDLGFKFRRECVQEFDSRKMCSYRFTSNTLPFRMNFYNSTFLTLNEETTLDDFYIGLSENKEQCNSCRALGTRITTECSEFANFY